MNVRQFNHTQPQMGKGVYIDIQSCVIGKVHLGNDVSIWPMAVLRADVNTITIGQGSNIQDNCTLHVTHQTTNQPNGAPLVIGESVTVGHRVVLHGCTIGNRCLIGISATILDNVIVQDEVLIGSGTLVPPGKILESGWLYLGVPAKRIRPLSDRERDHFTYSAQHYIDLKNQHAHS